MKSSVLFVDDEENILNAVRRLMEEWLDERGCQVETAGSVAQALALIEADPGRYRVVVSDLKMPVQIGTVLLKEVQTRWPDISTILLTGYAELEEIKKAIHSGIVAFIQKPWDPDLVMAEVAKALEMSDLRRKNREFTIALEDEARWARRIHHSLLMDSPEVHQVAGLDIAYRPARGAIEGGGDFFQLLWHQDQSIGICLGTLDVRGTQSTYYALLIRDMLREEILHAPDGDRRLPSKILERLNERIMSSHLQLPGCFLTLTVAVTDLSREIVTVASAGGESFFLFGSGKSEEHHLPSPGLGYRAGMLYQDRGFMFLPGDRIAFASRPLVGSPEVREHFVRSLTRSLQAGPRDAKVAEAILAEVLGSQPLGYDATLMILHRPEIMPQSK